ncbi:hypothetical protein KIPB_003703, partial [Kipferlia bialata]
KSKTKSFAYQDTDTQLQDVLEVLRQIALRPDLYAEFLTCGGGEAVIGLISHANVDIGLAAATLLSEMLSETAQSSEEESLTYTQFAHDLILLGGKKSGDKRSAEASDSVSSHVLDAVANSITRLSKLRRKQREVRERRKGEAKREAEKESKQHDLVMQNIAMVEAIIEVKGDSMLEEDMEEEKAKARAAMTDDIVHVLTHCRLPETLVEYMLAYKHHVASVASETKRDRLREAQDQGVTVLIDDITQSASALLASLVLLDPASAPQSLLESVPSMLATISNIRTLFQRGILEDDALTVEEAMEIVENVSCVCGTLSSHPDFSIERDTDSDTVGTPDTLSDTDIITLCLRPGVLADGEVIVVKIDPHIRRAVLSFLAQLASTNRPAFTAWLKAEGKKKSDIVGVLTRSCAHQIVSSPASDPATECAAGVMVQLSLEAEDSLTRHRVVMRATPVPGKATHNTLFSTVCTHINALSIASVDEEEVESEALPALCALVCLVLSSLSKKGGEPLELAEGLLKKAYLSVKEVVSRAQPWVTGSAKGQKRLIKAMNAAVGEQLYA